MAEVPLLLIFSRKANGPDLTIVKDELKSKATSMLFATAGAVPGNWGCAQSLTENSLSTFSFIICRTSIFWVMPKPTTVDEIFVSTRIKKTPLYP